MGDVDVFSDEQKQYLQGFMAGAVVSRQARSTFGSTLAAQDALPAGPERVMHEAQDRFTASGKKVTPEETAKRKRFPLDLWDEIGKHCDEGRYPKGTDVLMFKFNGLFYVAPAQDSYMTRLRFAGGILTSGKLRAVADIAEAYAAGHADVTTRANLQIREIPAANGLRVLEALHEAGIVNRGAGADNIRNVTANA